MIPSVRALNPMVKLAKVRVNKYGNKKTKVDGITFDSKKEAERYVGLKTALKAGLITNLVLQPQYIIIINEINVGSYIADFSYLKDGKIVIEDVKGLRTPLYKFKKKCVEAQFGIKVNEI